MGIKSLTKFLKTVCPDIFVARPLSVYRNQVIAVDVSIYIHKFKKSAGHTWLYLFTNMVTILLKNGIKPLFIYEGTALQDKKVEQERRRAQREKALVKIKNLEDSLIEYEISGQANDILIEAAAINGALRRLSTVNMINTSIIKYIINKAKIRQSRVDDVDMKTTQNILQVLGVPWIYAKHEAETLCSDLCIQGRVHAVMSDDSDVYAYATPIMLSGLDLKNQIVYEVHYTQILDNLELSSKQFLDFCIMCGTDYNKNIFRIGPKKSFDLIRRLITIEEVSKIHDVDILNHQRVRSLFRDYDKYQEPLPQSRTINMNEAILFFVTHNMKNITPLIKSLHV